MPKIEDIEVVRHYRCSNEECEAEIAKSQKATEDFVRICPFCEKETLRLVKADCKISGVIGMESPKTVGSIAEKNRARMEKNGEITKGQAQNYAGKEKKNERPWWRKTDKINFDVLKNPKRYIETGKI